MGKLLFVGQGVLQSFIGVGAVVCGALFIIAPDGRLIGAPLHLLRDTPFHNFLLPGLILLLINGIGQLAAATLTFRRHTSAGIVGGVFGLGMLIWIFVQVNMIGGRDVLQYSYFTFGLVETTLAFFIDRRLRPGTGAS